MAKFCSKCGKKLEDGGKCASCASVSSNSNIGENLLGILKGFFIKPITTVKEYATENNFYVGLILLGAASIMFGIMYAAVFGAFISMLFGSFGSFFQPDWFPLFLQGTFLAILFYAVFVFGIFITLTKVFKQKYSLQKAVALVGTAAMINFGFCLAAWLFSFFSGQLMTFALFISLILFAFNLYSGMKINDKVKENNIFLALGSMYAVLWIVLIIYSQIIM